MNTILFRFPGVDNVLCAFALRQAGNISLEVGDEPELVAANRRGLLAELGLERWRELKQVHGDRTVFGPAATDLTQASQIEADGQATDERGLGLLIKTADCQPVMLADMSGRYIAALHVGWKGNRLNMPGQGVKDMCRHYGLAPEELMAVRGPSLGPKASLFTDFDQEWGLDFRAWHDPASGLVNLWTMTRDQLLAAGLKPENIFSLDLCTFSLEESFFSFRRDRLCGRQASLIWRS